MRLFFFSNNYNIFKGEEETVNIESSITATPKSAKLIGTTFFGPDFNLEAFKGKKKNLKSFLTLF